MATPVRLLYLLLSALLCGCASGCFGISQNPSSFPHWVPFGDVVETHPKPIGASYYSNYDPRAVNLFVEPAIITSQVGSQVVVLATVKDAKDVPCRGRRIDWFVTGGHILEVDESGIFNGRGTNRGGASGYSFTNYYEHRLSRGNVNKLDDIMLRPGQSWCVVTSPVEGDTHLQVMVPAIYDWDKRVKTALIRWVDATWEFPARAVAKFGSVHEFATKVARHTDRLPLANYRVRYKIIDGPPAILLPSRAQEDTVVTDLSGLGKIKIAQLTPASGINRVNVEIIRPPDPTAPSGTGVPIASGETSVEWLAPGVRLSHTGPESAAVGTNIVYLTSAANTGRLESEWLEFTLPIPEGLEFVSSTPPTQPRDGQLKFPFGALGAGQTVTVQTTFKSKRPGPVKSVALLRTAEGQNDQKEANTRITTPQLKMDIVAPKTGLVDVPINYEIRLSNPGDGDLEDIILTAEFDKGLEHEMVKNQAKNFLEVKVAPLAAGAGPRRETLTLTPRQAGALGVRITASSSGQTQQGVAIVNVQQPKVSIKPEGPSRKYVGKPAEWKIVVRNDGDVDLSGVVVRDRLPAEQQFAFADRGGTFADGMVTWNLGSLRAREEVTLTLTTNCIAAARASEKSTLVMADGNVRFEQISRLEIQGIPALKMVMNDRNDPVEVGKNVIYDLTITNTGSAPASRIDVKATLPDLLKTVRVAGPTKETMVGKVITFATVPALQPGATITFTFECEALKAGDARFRVEYTSELNQVPIYEEEATHIVEPFVTGNGNQPPVVTPKKDGLPPIPHSDLKPLPKG
jgi:uncharacterized repeat protein (TIGR01451 family)